jgi:hypothetical protein
VFVLEMSCHLYRCGATRKLLLIGGYQVVQELGPEATNLVHLPMAAQADGRFAEQLVVELASALI